MKRAIFMLFKRAAVITGVLVFGFSTAGCKSNAVNKAAKYRAAFDADGGNSVQIVQDVKEKQSAAKPRNPVSEGFDFCGRTEPAGSVFRSKDPGTAGIEPEAVYRQAEGEHVKYKVTFKVGGGKPVPPAQTVEEYRKAVEPPEPVLKGFHFGGWVKPDGKIFDFNTPVTSDIKLNAKWQIIVTFDLNGGTFTDPSITDTTYTGYFDKKSAIIPPVVQKLEAGKNWRLKCWSVNSSAKTPNPFNLNAGSAVSLKLKAVWEKTDAKCTVYKVSFDADGGSPVPPVQTVKENDNAARPQEPVLAGFHLGGWMKPDGKMFDFNKPVTSDIKLKAKWQVIVTFDRNGGEFTDPSIIYSTYTKYADKNSAVTAPAVQRIELNENWKFSCWSVDPSAKPVVPFDLNAGSPVSVVLKAVWVEAEKKTSDWLLLLYADGDNDLNDPIYIDLNEIEHGLHLTRNPDGSAKSGYGSINAVVLWDGWTGDKKEKPTYGYSDSYMFELGSDSSKSRSSTVFGKYVLSSNTKDLSPSVQWLSSGEVDMSKKETLVNFLKWTKARYSAENVILILSNHGGGPGGACKSAAGKHSHGTRCMCWDENSGGQTFITEKDFSDALTEAGYGSGNKLSMIVEDLCLGCSIEEAYQLKDFAEYMIASPNIMDGYGLNYENFLTSLKKSASLRSIGENAVINYASCNNKKESEWDEIVLDQTEKGINEEDVIPYTTEALTITCIDLSKIKAVKDAVDGVAEVLLSSEAETKIFAGMYYDQSKKITKIKTGRPVFYRDYIKEKLFQPKSFLHYDGSYVNLHDIGYAISSMRSWSGSSDNKWPALYNAAANAAAALDAAIVNSWRDADNSTHALYLKSMPSYGMWKEGFYGITISGDTVESVKSDEKADLNREKHSSWYKKNLAFGADSKWGSLLQKWFPD